MSERQLQTSHFVQMAIESLFVCDSIDYFLCKSSLRRKYKDVWYKFEEDVTKTTIVVTFGSSLLEIIFLFGARSIFFGAIVFDIGRIV